MEKIAYDDLVNRLVAAVPELPADPEYVKDSLVYLVFNDLTRFVDSLLRSDGNDDLLQRIFDIIEAAARTNDRRIIDVLKDAFNELAIKDRDKTRSYMGRSTRRLYDEVWDEIYARPSVARKIGRSIRSLDVLAANRAAVLDLVAAAEDQRRLGQRRARRGNGRRAR